MYKKPLKYISECAKIILRNGFEALLDLSFRIAWVHLTGDFVLQNRKGVNIHSVLLKRRFDLCGQHLKVLRIIFYGVILC